MFIALCFLVVLLVGFLLWCICGWIAGVIFSKKVLLYSKVSQYHRGMREGTGRPMIPHDIEDEHFNAMVLLGPLSFFLHFRLKICPKCFGQ